MRFMEWNDISKLENLDQRNFFLSSILYKKNEYEMDAVLTMAKGSNAKDKKENKNE